MPSFTSQKVVCCFVPVVENVIMKTQERQRGEPRSLSFLNILEYQPHAGMVFTTLFQL